MRLTYLNDIDAIFENSRSFLELKFAEFLAELSLSSLVLVLFWLECSPMVARESKEDEDRVCGSLDPFSAREEASEEKENILGSLTNVSLVMKSVGLMVVGSAASDDGKDFDEKLTFCGRVNGFFPMDGW